MHSEILAPVVALVAWTLVMLVWMMAMRMPAMRKAGIDMGKLVGSKGTDADKVLPAQAQWKAHNYNHLHEQPTLFYAVALALALLGQGHGINLWLAWAYVILRIAHSVVQATVNRVSTRFALFLLSTLVLMALTLHAGMAIVLDHAPATPVETTAAAYAR
ncbi:MAPEG family protein [Sphingomonas sp. R-74633]|uniref:MAPEG family protein n=1 Tax=Sphingomonas sp. R-74633 TaxID=2751188 RepID=UPI0015D3C094|nr:MAPEG family protein [Sphingomonas sp. R-74633]NYT39491.1 MAPEG family protein [Sphingomonas sp. R-74633]